MICDADGYLKVDPGELFENPPTEDEASKGPSSEWAFDHKADVAAHHAKYTDVESRAAINNLITSGGYFGKMVNFNYNELINARNTKYKSAGGSTHIFVLVPVTNQPVMQMYSQQTGVGFVPCFLDLHNGTIYERVCVEPVADSKIATHAAVVAAHHAKYTDAEALAACGLDGNQFWSCPGIHFDATYPDFDQVNKTVSGSIIIESDNVEIQAAVILPGGATVIRAIVYGDLAAEDETWILKRLKLTDLTVVTMATASVNTVDESISYNTIDNSTYVYFFVTSSMDTDDVVYGARITYTL